MDTITIKENLDEMISQAIIYQNNAEMVSDQVKALQWAKIKDHLKYARSLIQ